MSNGFGDLSQDRALAAHQLREHRSGLSGFGGRPALHPAWRAPSDPDAARSDAGRDAAPPTSGVRR